MVDFVGTTVNDGDFVGVGTIDALYTTVVPLQEELA